VHVLIKHTLQNHKKHAKCRVWKQQQLLTLSRSEQQQHPQVDSVKGMQARLWQLPAQQAQGLLVCLAVNAEV
jgi:hypothetical protein